MESDPGMVDLGPLAPPYRALFERQKAALEALRGENAALSDRNRRLEHQEPVVEDLRAANASLTDRNRHLEDVNRRLEHLIRELRGVVYGKKSEKLDPDQLQLAFEALEGALAEAEEAASASTAPASAPARKRPRAERKHRPSSREPAQDRAGDRAREHTVPVRLRRDGAHRRGPHRASGHRSGAASSDCHGPAEVRVPRVRGRRHPGPRRRRT